MHQKCNESMWTLIKIHLGPFNHIPTSYVRQRTLEEHKIRAVHIGVQKQMKYLLLNLVSHCLEIYTCGLGMKVRRRPPHYHQQSLVPIISDWTR